MDDSRAAMHCSVKSQAGLRAVVHLYPFNHEVAARNWLLPLQIRTNIIRNTMERQASQPENVSQSLDKVAPVAERLRVNVAQLMAGRRDVVLVHGSEEYLLRITSLGKLILTK